MGNARNAHVAWIDHAKGICIVLVVMLYALELSEGGEESWLHAVEEFARPFRMPDFFLVSGLLLSRVIERDWRTYLDRKVVHFAYFYVLWLTLLLPFQARGIAAEQGWDAVAGLYGLAMVRPYSLLWFIYLLPLFFCITKLTRRLPRSLLWLLAAAMHVAQMEPDLKVFDKFAAYYVFFYTGYAFAPLVFRLASAAQARPGRALCLLGAWALVNGWLAATGYAFLPALSLASGCIGALAVVALAALVCHSPVVGSLRYCGRNSMVVYLAFLIPMTATHKLASLAGIDNAGTLALLATAGGVCGALLWHRLVRNTPFRFLFERPRCFALDRTRGMPIARARST